MKYKEFKQIDLQTGEVIESYLLDIDVKDFEVPEDYKECWVNKSFYKPIYGFELDMWIEGLTSEEIEAVQNETNLSELEVIQERMDEQDILVQEILFDIIPNLLEMERGE